MQDEQTIQRNILLHIAKTNKIQVNISHISDILEVDYRTVKHEMTRVEGFPPPIVDGDLPLAKEWLLYEVLLWALNQQRGYHANKIKCAEK